MMSTCWLLQAGPVVAITGGPDTAVILGWRPTETKVYLVVHSGGVAGCLPQVYYLDLLG